MLIGRIGLWVLKAPFNKYDTKGLEGKIVRLVYMKTSVAGGRNVQQEVYAPVKWEAGYKDDLSKNLLLVTIESRGKEYTIPDKYIQNLYDNDLFFQTSYLTARLGRFPRSYDFEMIREEVRELLQELTGVPIDKRDVTISRSLFDSRVYSHDEAVLEQAERAANLNGGSFKSKTETIKEAENKISELTDKLKHYESFFS